MLSALFPQVAQLKEAQAKAAAQMEALQADHGSLRAAHAATQSELQGQRDRAAEAQGAAERAAAEQEAYVQMVRPVIGILHQTSLQGNTQTELNHTH